MKSVWNFVRGKNHPRSFVDETIFLILTFVYWMFFVVLAVAPLGGIGFMLSFVPLAFALSRAFLHDEHIQEGSKTVMTGLFFFAIAEYLLVYFLRADYKLVMPYMGIGIVGMMLETVYVFVLHHRQRFTIVGAARTAVSNKLRTVKTPTVRRPFLDKRREQSEVKPVSGVGSHARELEQIVSNPVANDFDEMEADVDTLSEALAAKLAPQVDNRPFQPPPRQQPESGGKPPMIPQPIYKALAPLAAELDDDRRNVFSDLKKLLPSWANMDFNDPITVQKWVKLVEGVTKVMTTDSRARLSVVVPQIAAELDGEFAPA